MFPYICNDLLEMVGKDVVKIRDEGTLNYWNEISADALSGLDRHWRCRRMRWLITDELLMCSIHKLVDMDVELRIHGPFLDGNLSPIDVILLATYDAERRQPGRSMAASGWHRGDVEADKIKIVKIGGVEYQHNTEDGTMIRTDDFKEVGVWNTETQEINFEDEDEGCDGLREIPWSVGWWRSLTTQ